MNWYESLLEKYWEHLSTEHTDQGIYELNREMNFMEEYLVYSKFGHADSEKICCDFCDWKLEWTVNYDLLTVAKDA
jgi:hypothetical protein|tara:strand:+ start:404 stop:631 length:228 start_codon:yes stop_codon:yes gene_type:complete